MTAQPTSRVSRSIEGFGLSSWRTSNIALGKVALRTSKYRATQEYRVAMIRTHLPDILARAAERAATGHAILEGVGQ